MKTLIKITAILFVSMLAISSTCFSQEYIKMERQKHLRFEKESETLEVKIKVTDEYNFFKVKIECTVTEGEIQLELLDPKGNLKGNFTIKTDSNLKTGKRTTVEESVRGSLEKTFRYPLIGDWIIKIKPNEAKGDMSIGSLLYYHPKADMLEMEQIEEDLKSKME
jgi:hypothetical protein